MRLSKLLVSMMLLGFSLSAWPAIAKHGKHVPPGHAKVHHDYRGAPHRHVMPGPRKRVVVFSRSEHALVRQYFIRHPVAWSALPPGIAKNYARGKPLPPGIAKKVLPWGLASRLPPRVGYRYYQVGRDVVLIDTATLLVVDIMLNVFG
jgi:Ni/Co efflux regulator RcnB